MIKPLQPGFRPRKNKQTGLRARECVSSFGDERSKPMTGMLIMPYGTESKSRNADFISIALRAIHNPRANGPSNLRTLRPRGRSILRTFPCTTLLHNLPPSGGHNPRGEAPSTFPSEPFEPSRQRRVRIFYFAIKAQRVL